MLTRRTALALAAAPVVGQSRPHVVFVTGDDEYRSEYSMPAFARILEARHGLRTSVAYARPTPQTADNIEGLEALASADLAVFFLRWRVLPEAQMRRILTYVESGKPLAGFRTTTHAFRYPKDHPFAPWNDGFGRDIFGQKWFRHHGHMSSTRVVVAPESKDHPVLRGVSQEFPARSWLYTVAPLVGDCNVLLIGRAVNPQNNRDDGPQPVAWVKTYKGARVFFTTLGHPEDFFEPSIRRLVVNGLLWALGREIPRGGAAADWVEDYRPPASGIPPQK